VPGNAVTPDDLLLEARAIFPDTLLASDFLSLTLAGAGATGQGDDDA
jgi:ribonuclease Z